MKVGTSASAGRCPNCAAIQATLECGCPHGAATIDLVLYCAGVPHLGLSLHTSRSSPPLTAQTLGP
eukprot:6035204-Amphidinium_carterae.1